MKGFFCLIASISIHAGLAYLLFDDFNFSVGKVGDSIDEEGLSENVNAGETNIEVDLISKKIDLPKPKAVTPKDIPKSDLKLKKVVARKKTKSESNLKADKSQPDLEMEVKKPEIELDDLVVVPKVNLDLQNKKEIVDESNLENLIDEPVDINSLNNQMEIDKPTISINEKDSNLDESSVFESQASEGFDQNLDEFVLGGSGSDLKIFSANDLTPISGHRVHYPLESRRLKESGRVKIHLYFDANGIITKSVIIQGSGYSRLDNAVIEGVQYFKFKPMGFPFIYQTNFYFEPEVASMQDNKNGSVIGGSIKSEGGLY